MLLGALLPGLLLTSGLAPAAVPAETTPPEPLPGEVVLVAGTGEIGYSGDGGPATEARLHPSLTLSVAPDGTVYLADRYSERLRFVGTDGVIDTVAGARAQRPPETDGPEPPGGGSSSLSSTPIASSVGPDGSVYLAASQDVRRIAPDGAVSVLAGAGDDRIEAGDPDGGLAADADIFDPTDIAVDADGNVYLADTMNGRIRRIGTDGVITTVAGGGEVFVGDGAVGGPATDAAMDAPITSIAVDTAGTVFFTIEPFGDVYHVAPDGTLGVIADADLALLDAESGLDGRPARAGRRLAAGPGGELYVTDEANGRLLVLREGVIEIAGPLPSSVEDVAAGTDGAIYYTASSRVWRLPDDVAARDDQVPPAGSPWGDRDPGELVTVAGEAADPGIDALEELVPPPGPAAGPSGVAAGPDGVTYVADSHRHVVHRVDADGTVTVAAGTGEAGRRGDGGPAGEAQLSGPAGLDVDAEGNLYIADSSNATIRRVGTDGIITTVAGTAPDQNADDEPPPTCVGEPATETALGLPADVAIGPDGTLYLADPGRDLICRVGPDGLLTRAAGGGERYAENADDQPAVEASLDDPVAVEVDAAGNVYVVENGIPQVRMVRPDGTLVALAGVSYFGSYDGGFGGDGGPAVAAELNTPLDVAAGPDGLYIADTFNSRIRRVGADGVIATVAGTGSPHDTGDGGSAAEAGVNEPETVDVAPDGTVLLGSARGDLVRRIGADGIIETVADFRTAAAEPADAAELTGDMSVAVTPDGTLFVAEPQVGRLRRLEGTELAGAPAADPRLDSIRRLATGPGGEVYAALGDSVVRVYPDGRLVTVAGGAYSEHPVVDGALATTQLVQPRDVAVGPDGTVYLLDSGERPVYRVDSDGLITAVPGFDADTLALPSALAVGPDGTVYVTDEGSGQVVAAAPGQDARTFAGTSDSDGVVVDDDYGDGGPATRAQLWGLVDVAVGPEGDVYVATEDGVRHVDAEGIISTVLDAELDGDTQRRITALEIGPGGDLYVVDSATEQVLAVVRPGEITGGFPWWLVGVGAGVLIAAAAAVLLVRRRRLA